MIDLSFGQLCRAHNEIICMVQLYFRIIGGILDVLFVQCFQYEDYIFGFHFLVPPGF